MSSSQPIPTLAIFLSLGPTQQIVRTRWFRGPYVTAGSFLTVCSHLYENSALLGRAMRDKLLVLEQMLGTPKQPGILLQQLQRMANDRLTSFGGHPPSFFSFFIDTELRKLGLSLAPSHPEVLRRFGEKLSLEAVNLPIQFSALEGIAFGAEFPDLTERMYRDFHEKIDRGAWDEARAAGLSLPDAPTVISLEEQEQTVLKLVAAYATEYRPDLVARLGLSTR